MNLSTSVWQAGAELFLSLPLSWVHSQATGQRTLAALALRSGHSSSEDPRANCCFLATLRSGIRSSVYFPSPRCCCSAHRWLQDPRQRNSQQVQNFTSLSCTLRTQKVCQVSAYFSRLNRSGAPAWSVRSKMPSASSSCLTAATLRALRTATIRWTVWAGNGCGLERGMQ